MVRSVVRLEQRRRRQLVCLDRWREGGVVRVYSACFRLPVAYHYSGTFTRHSFMKHLSNTLLLMAACSFLSPACAQAQTTLFSDNFDADSSASWDVFGGSASGTPDHTVLFAFDYSTNRFTRNGVTATIPPAPNGGGKGVKMWVNKDDTTAETAAVSIFPKGKVFSGQYALTFDMWLNYNGPGGGGTGSTEYGTFGINHVGDKVIWQDSQGTITWAGDGVWFALTGEGGAAGDYLAFTGDGASPAVRVPNTSSMLDRDGDGTVEDEVVFGSDPADYPLAQMFPAPEFETAGMPSKQWVRVEIRQRTNEFGSYVVTWLINNYVIAEHSAGEGFGMTSGNVMLGNMDVFASIANPAADNFVIYDNVRVVDLNSIPALPVVTLSTNDATAAEPSDTGSVTITRAGNTSGPLTVNYRVSGSAQAGLDYTALPGSVLLAAGQTSTNITINPINDVIGEGIETVTLALSSSPNYDLYTNLTATITLADDNDMASVTVSTTKTNAYEANPNNEGRFEIRLSNPSSSAVTVNFSLGGTAVAGTDYTAVGSSVSIPAGETNAVIRIRPINNSTQQTARTVTLALSSGTGYSLGAVTNGMVTIRDDDFLTGATLVYSEDFETDPAADWTVNPSGGDHPVELGFDYSTAGIPAAPNASPTGVHGAKLQANLSGGVFGGVSISPASLNLTNDYAVRFDMWQNFNGPAPLGGSGSTQISGGGVGTRGVSPLWPGGTQEGVWFAVTGDGQSTVDYRAYSSAASTGYTEASGVFTGGSRVNTDAYYHEFGGSEPPAEQAAIFPSQTGASGPGAPAFLWREVLIKKVGNTVTWYMDGKLLATVPADATNFAGGNIALLHSDINTGSSSDPNAFVTAFGLFDNVRAYQLITQPSTPANITAIRLVNNGTTVQVDFDGTAQDTASAFTLQASANAASGYADAAAATISQLSPGKFRATIAVSGDRQFYRVRR